LDFFAEEMLPSSTLPKPRGRPPGTGTKRRVSPLLHPPAVSVKYRPC
jgi:hypothetical protein